MMPSEKSAILAFPAERQETNNKVILTLPDLTAAQQLKKTLLENSIITDSHIIIGQESSPRIKGKLSEDDNNTSEKISYHYTFELTSTEYQTLQEIETNVNATPHETTKPKQDTSTNKQLSFFAGLPREVIKTEIGQYLSTIDKKSLAHKNRHLSLWLKDEIKPANDLIRQFVTLVAHGKKDEVEAMLKDDPRLLLYKAEVVDEAGRTLYGTAYQIALGAKDISIHPGVKETEEMAEMIERYFKEKIPDGEKMMAEQKAEQFPKGWEDEEKIRKQNDSVALKKVFEAIKNAKVDQNGQLDKSAEEAVKTFQSYLKETQTRHIIKTGYHFNDALFEEACQLYEDNYSDFGGFNSPKNRLAAINVIGGIQAYFTANLAQAACTGFKRCVDEKKAIVRSKLLDDKRTLFFDSKLGVGHFVYSYFSGRVCMSAYCHTALVRRLAWSFSQLMSSKNENMDRVTQPKAASFLNY